MKLQWDYFWGVPVMIFRAVQWTLCQGASGKHDCCDVLVIISLYHCELHADCLEFMHSNCKWHNTLNCRLLVTQFLQNKVDIDISVYSVSHGPPKIKREWNIFNGMSCLTGTLFAERGDSCSSLTSPDYSKRLSIWMDSFVTQQLVTVGMKCLVPPEDRV